MKCSICVATYNKAVYLDRTLRSIFLQKPAFDFEVVICDDGSTDHTKEVCGMYPVKYIHSGREKGYYGPSVPRNIAYKAAKGEILICQSDEVIHWSDDVIENLCNRLHKGRFVIATVYDFDWMTQTRIMQYTGNEFKRPLFFLGSLYRKDLYVVGGNDEDFRLPGYEDNWFGDCLIRGLGLEVEYADDVLGMHQRHDRPDNLAAICQASSRLYGIKSKEANAGEIKFEAAGGPWPYDT